MHMFMCTHVSCTHVCILRYAYVYNVRAYTRVCIRVCSCIHQERTCKHIHSCICTFARVHRMCLHVYGHTCMCAYVHTYMHGCIVLVFMYICTHVLLIFHFTKYTHTYMRTWACVLSFAYSLMSHACTNSYAYACICTCAMHTCMHECMCAGGKSAKHSFLPRTVRDCWEDGKGVEETQMHTRGNRFAAPESFKVCLCCCLVR